LQNSKINKSLSHYEADNAGSNKLSGLYGLGCNWPCRICLCENTQLLNPCSSGYSVRDSEEAKMYLVGAFSAFCKKKKASKLSSREIASLKYCENNSLHPIMLAVMNIGLPYIGFSAYEYFRPDIMHTLLGRLKTWVFSTIVCCFRISKSVKGDYVHSLSNLDEALINFLPHHSLPFEFHHFRQGVTIFCLASTESKRSKLSTSGLGKIDYSRIVSLVIQMLIGELLCKIAFMCNTIILIRP